MGPRNFAIFDVFNNERGREAHMNGGAAKQLMAKAPQLFVKQPELQRLDVIADKLPH
jgi:quinol monooxygenase YgiN